MQRVDFVIAGVAVLALVGSLLGVALYDQPDARRYDVRFTEDADSDDVWADELTGPAGAASADKETTWSLTEQNLTRIEFTVTLSGTVSARLDDTVVRFEFHGPQDQHNEVEFRFSGSEDPNDSDVVHFDLNPLPEDVTRVLARSPEGALEQVEEDHPLAANGTGTWTIRATITSGGAIADPVLGTVIEAEEISFEVTAAYQSYNARAELRVPDPRVG